MFTILRIWYTVTAPCAIIPWDDATIPLNETGIQIQGTSELETLDWLGITGDLLFVTDTMTYPFPLQGSDFLTAKIGSLLFAAQGRQPDGLYTGKAVNRKNIYGVCGYGRTGEQQGGNVAPIFSEAGTLVQMQFYTIDGVSGVTTALPYTVPIVSTLWMD